MRCLVQQLNRTFSCHSLTSRCLHHGALSHFLYPVIFVFFSLLVEILEKKINPKLLILDHFVTFNVTEMSKQSKYYFLSNRNFLHLFQFFLSQHNGTWYIWSEKTMRWYSIWLKSHLSLAPLSWYVAAWEIWRNSITSLHQNPLALCPCLVKIGSG
jgi:hypothetical protein